MVDINYDTGDVLIDGKAIDEPLYPGEKIETRDNVPMPFTRTRRGSLRQWRQPEHSTDSRFLIGSIDKRYVMGRAIFRIFPLSKFGGSVRRDLVGDSWYPAIWPKRGASFRKI
jgi:signal peptidase I